MKLHDKDVAPLNSLDRHQRTPGLRAGRASDSGARLFNSTLGVRRRNKLDLTRLLRIASAVVAVCLLATTNASAQIETPSADPRETIIVTAAQAETWQQGSYEVWVLSGDCHIEQGGVRARSSDAVLWIDRTHSFGLEPNKMIVYLEGNVSVDYLSGSAPHGVSGVAGSTIVDNQWLGRFYSIDDIELRIPRVSGAPASVPEIYRRGLRERDPRQSVVQPAQFTVDGPAYEEIPAPTGRRIQAFPRSSVPVQARTVASSRPGETIVVIDSGVNILIDGVDQLGSLDIAADRIVLWAQGLQNANLTQGSQQQQDMPFEIYMEGNIVFRQADRVIYAKAMYYNVNGEFGVVLDAEMLTPVPEYQGLLRLKADVLQQVDRSHFQATGAAFTSSRMGVPRYWFQSQQIEFQDELQPRHNPFTGQPEIDPLTGDFAVDHKMLATSQDNFVYLGGMPIFYWPTLATDLTSPTYYINSVSFRSDSIFGVQLLTKWDMYQLLGIRNPPVGTKLSGRLDLLSERGIGTGLDFNYQREGSLGLPGTFYGPYSGSLDAWAIYDTGLDDLGADRRALTPEQRFRGKAVWQHRHHFGIGYQVTAEAGWISDRNFLEQYYEQEWDTYKDADTTIQLKRIIDNRSWSVAGQVRINSFFTQSDSIRADHFLLGTSLFGDRLTWFEHSHIGYFKQNIASTPTDPADAATFTPLAWEMPGDGVRLATRQELDLPFSVGPVDVVPYVLGEVAYWGSDLLGADVTRAYGQVGVRSSMPMWRVDPTVQSSLLNLNGLAHKVTFEAEALYADANQSLGRFPLYDPLDDDAIEHFRRRTIFNTFGLAAGSFLPAKYDERFFALRYGLQGNVTSPVTEIADDLMLARLGVRQRWQTKRGLPGNERIVDWITLDVEGVVFGNANRDNFGQEIGLLDYDFRWHVGDRLSLLSDGYFDVFGQGLRTFSVGALASRPEMGNIYIGFRSIEGPLSSNVVSAAINYRMSEKWIGTFGTSVDFGAAGNIGQLFEATRIGESFLLTIGMNVDESRGNVGFRVAVEPRFIPNRRRGTLGGVPIAPPGTRGLE